MPTTGIKYPFVSTTNEALVGALITIGDVNDISSPFSPCTTIVSNKFNTIIFLRNEIPDDDMGANKELKILGEAIEKDDLKVS